LPQDVFTQANLVAEFIPFKLIFIDKNEKLAFCTTLWESHGNLRTSSVARRRLPVRDN